MARLIIFASFLVVTAASAADAALGTVASHAGFRPILPLPAQDDDGYTECDGYGSGQMVCADNCTKVLLCMGGTLDPIVLEECEGDLKCNAQEGKCVNGTSSCETVTSTITCHSLGVFPDPYDCTAYHMCCTEDGESERVKCDGGYAYNPSTTFCSEKLTGDVCTNLPVKCNTLGETNAFPGDPQYYYICIADENEELYPDLYRCPHGGTYNPSTYSCIEDSS